MKKDILRLVLKIKREHEINILRIQDTFNRARIEEAKSFYNKKGEKNVHHI